MFAVHKIRDTGSWHPAGAEVGPRQWQCTFSEQTRARFASDPKYQLNCRKRIKAGTNGLFPMLEQGSDVSDHLRKLMTEEMHRRIGPGHERLKAYIVPYDCLIHVDAVVCIVAVLFKRCCHSIVSSSASQQVRFMTA